VKPSLPQIRLRAHPGNPANSRENRLISVTKITVISTRLMLADDTVLIEPVSDFKFPASKEFAGNFADSGCRVLDSDLYLTSKISGF
jgi:hypothetical protein